MNLVLETSSAVAETALFKATAYRLAKLLKAKVASTWSMVCAVDSFGRGASARYVQQLVWTAASLFRTTACIFRTAASFERLRMHLCFGRPHLSDDCRHLSDGCIFRTAASIFVSDGCIFRTAATAHALVVSIMRSSLAFELLFVMLLLLQQYSASRHSKHSFAHCGTDG